MLLDSGAEHVVAFTLVRLLSNLQVPAQDHPVTKLRRGEGDPAGRLLLRNILPQKGGSGRG